MRHLTSRRAALSWAALVLGLVMVLGGAWLASRNAERGARPPGTSARILPDDGFPELAGAPTGPTPAVGTRLRILDLGIDLAVVSGDGWTAPLYRAATYPGLKLPGEGGRSLIYAHARPGMFGPLAQAKTGQLVEVSRPDGTVLHYRIRQFFAAWPATDLSWLGPATHEEIVLVTCTTYNPNDPRVVVVAEPV